MHLYYRGNSVLLLGGSSGRSRVLGVFRGELLGSLR